MDVVMHHQAEHACMGVSGLVNETIPIRSY